MDSHTLLEQSTRKLQELLQHAPQESLTFLCEYSSDKNCDLPDPDRLIRELRRSGSNDIVRLLTGHQAHYLEIVRDVAGKLKIEWKKDDDEEKLEKAIFLKVFQQAWVKMSNEEREPVRHLLESQGADAEYVSKLLIEGTMVEFLPTISYLVVLNIARMVAVAAAVDTAGLAAGEAISGLVAETLFGVLGIVVGTIVFIVNLAGPAYRKTIPAVLQIAYIRQLMQAEKNTI
ncbi:hypothetical protein [Sporomusa sp.]|uniref:hypothetical protein n=1 Tax=Sporomusa sp. TaxID=2078658 RepID=UPI002CE24AFA|nr:hypothetical protein [Sporomusa sp.]HWR43953.1 hypothetical protein [Sporomusa sp.]